MKSFDIPASLVTTRLPPLTLPCRQWPAAFLKNGQDSHVVLYWLAEVMPCHL